MLARPIYESLPYGYLAVGSSSLVMLDQLYATLAAILMFAIGAKIYNLRSAMRRTDNRRRRKSGRIPAHIYDSLPFGYFFIAIVILKYASSNSEKLLAFCLAGYGLFILFRRASYRHHQIQRDGKPK